MKRNILIRIHLASLRYHLMASEYGLIGQLIFLKVCLGYQWRGCFHLGIYTPYGYSNAWPQLLSSWIVLVIINYRQYYLLWVMSLLDYLLSKRCCLICWIAFFVLLGYCFLSALFEKSNCFILLCFILTQLIRCRFTHSEYMWVDSSGVSCITFVLIFKLWISNSGAMISSFKRSVNGGTIMSLI